MGGNAAEQLRLWSQRCRQVAAEPVSEQAKEAVASLLQRSASVRMDQAIAPDGTAHKPLSRRYAKRKQRQRGHSRIWQLTGESKRRTDTFVTDTGVQQVINTPYSGAVHDGATFTVHAKPRSAAAVEKHRKAVASRTRRFEKALREQYDESGRGGTARARAKHGEAQRSARLERNRERAKAPEVKARRRIQQAGRAAVKAGLASALPRAKKQPRAKKTSWTVTIPARQVLGVSEADAEQIERILVDDLKRRLEDG